MTTKKRNPQSKLLTTGPFQAVFPSLNEPNTKFSPVYEVQMRFDPKSEDWKNFKKQILDIGSPLFEELGEGTLEKNASMPWREETIKDSETGEKKKTGMILVRFKKKAEYQSKRTGETVKTPVAVFDTAGNRVKGVPIWGGSTIQVAYRIIPWKTAMGHGLSLRLEQALIIELVTANQNQESVFGTDKEGYVVENNSNDDDEGFGNDESKDEAFPY